MVGAIETEFLHQISLSMPKLSQKPGFWVLGFGGVRVGAIETEFLSQILVEMEKLSKKPGFWSGRPSELIRHSFGVETLRSTRPY